MSIAVVLYSLGLLALLLALHPFVTYPLSLLLLKKLFSRNRRSASPSLRECDGNFSICMCAYNEEQVIEEKIKNLLALRKLEPQLEIMVYVDGATDRTVQLLKPYSRQINLYVGLKRRGKSYGMNLLVAHANAAFVIFTDANVIVDIDAIHHLKRHFSDPQVGCVCGNLQYVNSDESVTAATGSLYWRLEEATKLLEQATGSVMGADGSLFAIRRSLHHPPPDHIIDDMYVSFRVLCDGYRIVQATDVRAYEKSLASSSGEFRRKSRIACQAFNVHRELWPLLKKLDGLTIYKYLSHKLLRWLSIYFLLLAALLIEAALIVAHQYVLAIAMPLLAALSILMGHWSIKPFAQLTEILRALSGTGLGVWKSLRGEQYQTWQPSSSLSKAQ